MLYGILHENFNNIVKCLLVVLLLEFSSTVSRFITFIRTVIINVFLKREGF